MILRFVLSSCFALLLLGNGAHAQWSTIKGKFTFVGDVPVLPPLVCGGAGAGNCCAKPLPDETLVISAKKELANVFIYARSVKKIDPALKNGLQPLELTNKGCLFVPHAAIMWTEQKLEMVNADPDAHNMKFDSATQGFNELIPAKGKSTRDLKGSESVPKPIVCNLHNWMRGNLLVRDNPYFAVSAADGTFEIKNVPNDEEIEFQIWHEKVGNLAKVNINGQVTAVNGRFKLKADKDVDLGEIKVDAKQNLKL